MSKKVYLVWQHNRSDDDVIAVQVYLTKRGARSAIRNYKQTHNDSSIFVIQEDLISVPFGTNGKLLTEGRI